MTKTLVIRRIAVLAVVGLAWAAPAGAAGDRMRGEKVFQYCYSCHSVEPGDTEGLQGPHLAGIVGRRIAAQAGFDYSPALRAFAEREGVWSEALLDRYLADPLAVVPKTKMAFPGVRDAQEREDLIAFLKATGP
jgi:cytochrome c